MTDYHMARVYLREASSLHGNEHQREFVSQLVRWARARNHRHIKAGKTGQQELKL